MPATLNPNSHSHDGQIILINPACTLTNGLAKLMGVSTHGANASFFLDQRKYRTLSKALIFKLQGCQATV